MIRDLKLLYLILFLKYEMKTRNEDETLQTVNLLIENVKHNKIIDPQSGSFGCLDTPGRAFVNNPRL